MLLVLARHRVAIHWGCKPAPLSKTWLADAAQCQMHFSEYWNLMPLASRPHNIWAPLATYLLQADDTDELPDPHGTEPQIPRPELLRNPR